MSEPTIQTPPILNTPSEQVTLYLKEAREYIAADREKGNGPKIDEACQTVIDGLNLKDFQGTPFILAATLLGNILVNQSKMADAILITTIDEHRDVLKLTDDDIFTLIAADQQLHERFIIMDRNNPRSRILSALAGASEPGNAAMEEVFGVSAPEEESAPEETPAS